MTTYNGESAGIADTEKYRIVFEDPTTLPRCSCAFEPIKECANCLWFYGQDCGNQKCPFMSFFDGFNGREWFCSEWEVKE